MEYDIRVVAFIDILGFKNSVDKSTNDKKEFERILKTLKDLKDFFIESKDKYDIMADRILGADTQIVQISDSLIISRLIQEQGGIYNMLSDCAFAIHLLISNGFLCRGAVKVGKMYHKGNTLFGEAYVKAYLAESEERLPIIKFDNDLFEIVKNYPGSANKGLENWEINFIKQNCKELMTGIYYLDYFTDYDDRVGGGEGSASAHYSKLRDIIVEGLEITKTKSAYEKYRWAADQFNLSSINYGLNKIE